MNHVCLLLPASAAGTGICRCTGFILAIIAQMKPFANCLRECAEHAKAPCHRAGCFLKKQRQKWRRKQGEDGKRSVLCKTPIRFERKIGKF
jgi:hypothetical protein